MFWKCCRVLIVSTWRVIWHVGVSVGSLTGSDIVESNPGKFKLGDNELQERRDFVERTRTSVQVNFIKSNLSFYWFFCHVAFAIYWHVLVIYVKSYSLCLFFCVCVFACTLSALHEHLWIRWIRYLMNWICWELMWSIDISLTQIYRYQHICLQMNNAAQKWQRYVYGNSETV